MKHLIVLLSVLVVLSGSTFSQTNISPNTQTLYYSWSIPVGGYADSTAVVYYNSRVDTLPNFRSAQTSIKAAGAKLLSLTIFTNDSSHATVVVKSRIIGQPAASYTAILTDSIYNWSGTPSTTYYRELSLKDGDSDLFDNVDQEFIIIITHVAFGNETQGVKTRRVRLNWSR